MDFDNTKPPAMISTFSRYSMGEVGAAFGLANPNTGIQWPTVNKAFLWPLTIPFKYNLRRFFVANSGAVANSFDIGIYTLGLSRIVSTGSVVQAGLSQLQFVAVSPDILLMPGTYYLALSTNTTTGQYIRSAGVPSYTYSGQLEKTSAFPLPNPIAPVTPTVGYVALCGISSSDSGF